MRFDPQFDSAPIIESRAGREIDQRPAARYPVTYLHVGRHRRREGARPVPARVSPPQSPIAFPCAIPFARAPIKTNGNESPRAGSLKTIKE